MAILVLAVPAVTALGFLVPAWRRGMLWAGAASALVSLAAAIALATTVVRTGPVSALGGLLRADALSAFLLVVISAVAVPATLATPGHFAAETAAGRATERTAARHGLLVHLFLAAMTLAVLAANLGLLWVSIEATTVVTAFLVGQSRTRTAVEAAWKYVVICSAGLALALLGTLLLGYASGHAGGGLDLAGLAAGASGLDSGVTRIAVTLLVLGFGAKAGLAPLHAWLPDAHSQAPAPVSALMSGVLLAVAFYAVLRVKVVSDAALGAGFARGLLTVMALASLLVAATLLLAQRDYKRMLAYSSIEHLGLVSFGAAVGGPVATAAVLVHVLGHGLVKAVLFLGAGRVAQGTGTSRIDRVRGLAARGPVLAGCLGAGVLALAGMPPFSLFASELGLARAGFAGGLGWATAIVLVLVLVVAAALAGHTTRMLLGDPPGGPGAARAPVTVPRATRVALAVPLVAGAVLGFWTGPLSSLLHAAASAGGGAS